MSKSSKQKLNTKSSTEAEVVGASDYVPNSIWAAHFLEHQGYVLKRSIFHQDNQSAMKMERNGRSSCGQKSRHIDIRYFFIKDRVDSGEIDIVHCPTEMMVADFFTKPLQGALFRKLKSVIMGEIDVRNLPRHVLRAKGACWKRKYTRSTVWPVRTYLQRTGKEKPPQPSASIVCRCCDDAIRMSCRRHAHSNKRIQYLNDTECEVNLSILLVPIVSIQR